MRADPARRANFSAADNDQEGTAADPPPLREGSSGGRKAFRGDCHRLCNDDVERIPTLAFNPCPFLD
jgi:hypothetical protein